MVALSIISPTGAELPLASDAMADGPHRVMSGTAGLGLTGQQAAS